MSSCRAPTYRRAANAAPQVARHLRLGAEPQGIDRCGPRAFMCTVTHRLARSSRPQCSREWCLHSRARSTSSDVIHCLHLPRTRCLRLHACTLQQETGRGHGEPWCGCHGGHDGGLALQPRRSDGRCGIEHHRRACSCCHRGRRAACGIPRRAALDAVSPQSWKLIRLHQDPGVRILRPYHETFGLTSCSGRGVLRRSKHRRVRPARAPRSFPPVRDACTRAHRARSAVRRAWRRLQHLEKYDIRRTAPVGVCRDAGRRDRGSTSIRPLEAADGSPARLPGMQKTDETALCSGS